MNKYEKQLYDIYGPISFISLNHKLIEKYKILQISSISRYTTYCIITLFHNLVVDIVMVFDKGKRTSSLYNFFKEIKSTRLKLKDPEGWIHLFDSTYENIKPIINLRNNFHAHKNANFDINEYWEQNPNEFDKIPMIAENCIKLFEILSHEILGFQLDFNSLENDIIKQFDMLFNKYDN